MRPISIGKQAFHFELSLSNHGGAWWKGGLADNWEKGAAGNESSCAR